MRRVIGLEEFGSKLGELYSEVEELDQKTEEYKKTVDMYKKGEVSPELMEMLFMIWRNRLMN